MGLAVSGQFATRSKPFFQPPYGNPKHLPFIRVRIQYAGRAIAAAGHWAMFCAEKFTQFPRLTPHHSPFFPCIRPSQSQDATHHLQHHQHLHHLLIIINVIFFRVLALTFDRWGFCPGVGQQHGHRLHRRPHGDLVMPDPVLLAAVSSCSEAVWPRRPPTCSPGGQRCTSLASTRKATLRCALGQALGCVHGLSRLARRKNSPACGPFFPLGQPRVGRG